MSKSKKHQEKHDEEVIQEEISMEEALKKENEALLELIKALENEKAKAYADADNMKKRLQRDYELSNKYRIQSFALQILPALDNLERALAQKGDDSSEGYREGVKMIYDQIMASLKSEGVEPIEALNKKFDPNMHQAMSVASCEGVKPGIVVEEFQKGYLLKDRILRASLVKVSD